MTELKLNVIEKGNSHKFIESHLPAHLSSLTEEEMNELYGGAEAGCDCKNLNCDKCFIKIRCGTKTCGDKKIDLPDIIIPKAIETTNLLDSSRSENLFESTPALASNSMLVMAIVP